MLGNTTNVSYANHLGFGVADYTASNYTASSDTLPGHLGGIDSKLGNH